MLKSVKYIYLLSHENIKCAFCYGSYSKKAWSYKDLLLVQQVRVQIEYSAFGRHSLGPMKDRTKDAMSSIRH